MVKIKAVIQIEFRMEAFEKFDTCNSDNDHQNPSSNTSVMFSVKEKRFRICANFQV